MCNVWLTTQISQMLANGIGDIIINTSIIRMQLSVASQQ